jgi:hypothetical protein
VKAALAADPDLNITWVGTLGMPTDVPTERERADINGRLERENDSLIVFCKDSMFRWPLHSLLQAGLLFLLSSQS